jgi:uncharacterized protein with HEPN domain
MTQTEILRIHDFLKHILQAIGRIHRYIAGLDRSAFLANEEKQDAVIRNLEIIGEAAQNIRRNHPDFANSHSEFPWGAVYGMRNAVAHSYFNVDLEIVWKTVCNDLLGLETKVRALLNELGAEPKNG